MHGRQYLGLSLLLVLFLAGCGKSPHLSAAGGPADQPALDARLKQLLTDRVATTRLAREAVDAGFATGKGNYDDLLAVADAQWKAELAVADAPSQRIAIHKRHVEDMLRYELPIESLYKVAARGGSVEKYALAVFNLESAQIALVEACIAAGQPYPTFDADLDPANAAHDLGP